MMRMRPQRVTMGHCARMARWPVTEGSAVSSHRSAVSSHRSGVGAVGHFQGPESRVNLHTSALGGFLPAIGAMRDAPSCAPRPLTGEKKEKIA